jgi:hypothetical protein
MPCKKSLSVLLLTLGSLACGRLNETATAEGDGVESTSIEVGAVAAVGEQSALLMEYTDETAVSDPGCCPSSDSEVTGEAEQAAMEGPIVSNPWGDGAPDDHTYRGGSGGARGGYADPRNYHRGSSAGEIERARDADRRYWLGQKKKKEIQETFGRFREQALTGRRTRICGGGSVDHNACVWTCGEAIAESCQGIQALCAGSTLIVLSPYVSISCASAILASCIVGNLFSADLCDSLVCAGSNEQAGKVEFENLRLQPHRHLREPVRRSARFGLGGNSADRDRCAHAHAEVSGEGCARSSDPRGGAPTRSDRRPGLSL